MKIDVEILINKENDKHEIVDLVTGVHHSIPTTTAFRFEQMFGAGIFKQFTNRKELNKYIKALT